MQAAPDVSIFNTNNYYSFFFKKNLSSYIAGSLSISGQIGIYSAEKRRLKLERFFEKRKLRVWSKKIKYDVRKNFADTRVRIKGRFVRKDVSSVGSSIIADGKEEEGEESVGNEAINDIEEESDDDCDDI